VPKGYALAGTRRLRAPIDRFMSKIRRDEETDCWIWQDKQRSQECPYGVFHERYVRTLAHRWAYRYWKGAIVDGWCVLHTCDNPKCVNPSHLWLGTHNDNVVDRTRKGRSARGETHSMAKLTEAQVRQLREDANSGTSRLMLARKYDVCLSNVGLVVRRDTWGHM
jgi:hypothetical protein